jgi:hypothetical protein
MFLQYKLNPIYKYYFSAILTIIVTLIITTSIQLYFDREARNTRLRCEKMCGSNAQTISCVELKKNLSAIPDDTMITVCLENNKFHLLTEKK